MFAQTFQGSVGLLRDDGFPSEFSITIDEESLDSLSVSLGLKEVCINITHTWVSDLDIRLISPSGDVIMLTATLGNDLDNYQNTCFSHDASSHILHASAPFEGAFLPMSSLGMVNNGQSGIGIWKLHIMDQYPFADSGEVLSWSISFGNDAPAPAVDAGSYLPVIVIRTDDAFTIPNEPKIPGDMWVIDNGNGVLNFLNDDPVLYSRIGIETRGSSSQGFPKKNFGFETQDLDGDGVDVEILGLPEEEDFILYASYTDKSFLRDAITYNLGNKIQGYASRTVPVDVYINGDYHGIYWLEEKLKRDKNRINIKKLDTDDLDPDVITGGYILKVDRDDGPGTYFVSDYKGSNENEELRIVYEDPEGEDLHPDQQAYIQNFMRNFENALYGDDFMDPVKGYRRYADIHSAVDFFILNELGHNVDSYRLSSFMYKDRDEVDSLLKFGPVWDFNLAFGNVDYCGAEQTSGWTFITAANCGNSPMWWHRFMEDENFKCELRSRYEALRATELNIDTLNAWIEKTSSVISQSEERNFDRWPILGRYVWPNFFIGNTYEEEVEYFKTWLTNRIVWLDMNIPECTISGIEESTFTNVQFTPNPANDFVQLNGTGIQDISRLRVLNLNGIPVLSYSRVPENGRIDISSLPSGIYLLEMMNSRGLMDSRKISIIR